VKACETTKSNKFREHRLGGAMVKDLSRVFFSSLCPLVFSARFECLRAMKKCTNFSSSLTHGGVRCLFSDSIHLFHKQPNITAMHLFSFISGKRASIESLSLNLTVKEGKRVRIVCKVDGEPAPKVTWFKDGRSINRNRTKYVFVHLR
jgi:hypothetical protein